MDKEDIRTLKEAILRQAGSLEGDGWMGIAVPHELHADGMLPVPRGAFEQWSVRRSGGAHLATPWHPVSPVGVKQGADDPFHTDWILGAGLPPNAMHSSNREATARMLESAAITASAEVAERLLGHDSTVLLAGPQVRGVVLSPPRPGEVEWADAGDERPILVLGNASPNWLDDVTRALELGGAVIIERGGGTAHLVAEMRGDGRGPILRKPDARKLFPQGTLLDVYPGDGSIRMAENPHLPPALPSMFEELPSQTRARAEAVVIRERTLADIRRQPMVVHLWDGKGTKPGDQYNRLEPAYSVKGREWQVHASHQWQEESYGVEQPMALIMYVSAMPGHHGKRKVAWVEPRIWLDAGDVPSACHEALVMAAPSEAYDSPESQEVRRAHAEQEHDWWLRSHQEQTNEQLIASCRVSIRELGILMRADKDDPRLAEIVVFTDVTAYRDALASYDYTLKHYDIEFKSREMTERVYFLQPADEPIVEPASLPCP